MKSTLVSGQIRVRKHIEGEATCMTSPLHSTPLLGNALKRISELTSTVNQQPCGIEDDHDIIV